MSKDMSILLGDVVEHTNSHRHGCVVGIGRTHRDGTTEVRVQPARDDEHGTDQTWWNSAHVRRVVRRDPYRRYLAMVAVEDDLARQERRRRPPDAAGRHRHRRSRTYGPWLPEAAWDKAFWRLTNQRRHDPGGTCVYHDLGRESWERAAVDCLERRDRAARYWMQPRPSASEEDGASEEDEAGEAP